jgi:hypothetical protein
MRRRTEKKESPSEAVSGAGMLERADVSPNRFRWTLPLVALLGQRSDEALARRAGITGQAVAKERHRRGIHAFRSRREPVEWTDAMVGLLGTASDRAVAAELGVHHGSVFMKRRALGIAPFRPPVLPPGTQGYAWTLQALHQLGKASDRDVARQLGINATSVFAKRREMGIPSYRPPRRLIQWTRKMKALLGKVPDTEIARRFGIVKDSVSRKREELGIEPYRYRSRPIARTAELRKTLRLPNPEIRARYGLRKETAARLRAELGIPTPDSRNRRWTPEMVARLGREPDADIACDMGLVPAAVGWKRRSMGIRAFNSKHRWSDAETALLGKLSDGEVARKIGVTREAVKIRRRLLRKGPRRPSL